MKAISLWQPWATLIALGEKRIETRSWWTSHRGEIAIHAAQKWNLEFLRLAYYEEPFRSVLRRHGVECRSSKVSAPPYGIPLGAVVAVATLVDVRPTDYLVKRGLTEQEQEFGDYGVGRFGWYLGNVRMLREPVPCRGERQIFLLGPDVEAQVREQLGAAA